MRQLILFLSKYRNTLLLIVLVGFSLFRHTLKNPIAEHRINSVGFNVIATIQNALNSLDQYFGLEEVNQELARENAALRASLPTAKAPLFQRDSNYQYVPARVIEYSYTKRNNYMLLDVGTKDGVEIGMGVITHSGWIGTIVEISESYASVIPLLHLKGNIGGRIPGKGLGELSWNGSDHRVAYLHDIQREHEPVQGDSVYSFTRALVAPPVLSGFVVSATQNPEDLTWIAKVNLKQDFANLNWVYVCKLDDANSLDELNLPLP